MKYIIFALALFFVIGCTGLDYPPEEVIPEEEEQPPEEETEEETEEESEEETFEHPVTVTTYQAARATHSAVSFHEITSSLADLIIESETSLSADSEEELRSASTTMENRFGDDEPTLNTIQYYEQQATAHTQQNDGAWSASEAYEDPFTIISDALTEQDFTENVATLTLAEETVVSFVFIPLEKDLLALNDLERVSIEDPRVDVTRNNEGYITLVEVQATLRYPSEGDGDLIVDVNHTTTFSNHNQELVIDTPPSLA